MRFKHLACGTHLRNGERESTHVDSCLERKVGWTRGRKEDKKAALHPLVLQVEKLRPRQEIVSQFRHLLLQAARDLLGPCPSITMRTDCAPGPVLGPSYSHQVLPTTLGSGSHPQFTAKETELQER